jgi:hypothetical protein
MSDFRLFNRTNFVSGSEDKTINMPSSRTNDIPIETEVNPNAPKDIEPPPGINVPPRRLD